MAAWHDRNDLSSRKRSCSPPLSAGNARRVHDGCCPTHLAVAPHPDKPFALPVSAFPFQPFPTLVVFVVKPICEAPGLLRATRKFVRLSFGGCAKRPHAQSASARLERIRPVYRAGPAFTWVRGRMAEIYKSAYVCRK